MKHNNKLGIVQFQDIPSLNQYLKSNNKDIVIQQNLESDLRSYYSDKQYSQFIELFENSEYTTNITKNEEIINMYLWSLWLNDGTEDRAWVYASHYGDLFSTDRWDLLKGHYFAWKKQYDDALFYYKTSSLEYYNELLQKINKENEDRELEAENERKMEAERELDAEKERIRIIEAERELEVERERDAEREREKEAERKRIREEREKLIGSNHFTSSSIRGGDTFYPDHIYVNDSEVRWEKKTGVFSKDSKAIPMKSITQIDIESSFGDGSQITIRSKGAGKIVGNHFSKSDVREIERLINKVQSNL